MVILGNQNSKPFNAVILIFGFDFRFRRIFKRQRYFKHRAAPLLAFRRKRAAELFGQYFYYGKTEPQTAVGFNFLIVFLCERLKHPLLKFAAHADSAVLADKAYLRAVVILLLGKGKIHFAALITVLYGVYKDVYNYLVEIKNIAVKLPSAA